MSAPAEATQFWHLVTRPEEPPKATDMMASIADGKRRAARLSDLISPALAGFLLAGAARTLGEPLVDPTFANASRLANRLTRHLLGLYRGESGGKAFRRYLSEHGNRPQTAALLQQALQAVHPRA